MPKFNYGQFIVKKMRPVKDVTAIPMMGLLMYSRGDEAIYGIFRVDPYKKGDWEAPLSYKVTLTPVGKFSEYFLDQDFYTLDLSDTREELIFNELPLAEKFLEEFLVD